MKIGILSLPLHINYGGILQSYALQNSLKSIFPDANVTVINQNKTWTLPKWKLPLIYSKRAMKKIMGISNSEVFFEKRLATEWPIISQNTQRFVSENINTINVDTLYDLNEKDFDVIVVGSDQVWRRDYSWNGKIENSFLEFAKNWHLKRVAYAASFGLKNWDYTEDETNNCKKLLEKFDGVSLRETSGVDLVSKYLGCSDGVQVVDPTMLLTPESYRQLYVKTLSKFQNKRMMVYLLDKTNEKVDIVNLVHKHTTFDLYKIGIVDNYFANTPIEQRIQPPVEDWLAGFDQAEFVVTDSFHGCVFSILFNKPFIAIGNEERGMERFLSLLSIFNLEDRLVMPSSSEEEILRIIERKIDYDKVNRILDEERKKSISFLRKALVG